MAVYVLFGEALALGLASGPACIAACGPVLVPSLLAERAGWRPHVRPVPRGVGWSVLLTLPIALWSLLMFFHPGANTDWASRIAATITAVFMIAMFFMMMRTGTTY